MSSIIDRILEELESHDVREVQEVLMRIGELTFLGHEQLSFAFEILTKGTLLEGAKLVIEEEAARIRCPSCGYEGEANRLSGSDHFSVPLLSCPSCGKEPELLSGRGCRVVSLKVVED